MIASRETQVYREDTRQRGAVLSPKQREQLLKPYLPPPTTSTSTTRRHASQPVRDFLRSQLHLLIFTIMHTFFSIYIRIRQAYHGIVDRVFAILYYHHRAPELIKQDVRNLAKMPKHLSVILDFKGEERGSAGLETLMDEMAEICSWCACYGIPTLSVYEKTGVLKGHVPMAHRVVMKTLHSYLGDQVPSFQISAPTMPSYLDGIIQEEVDESSQPKGHLSIILLSAEDGRSTLVDLTKTLAEMAQRKKLSSDDISQQLVDAEISESVMGEPDLLVLFGPSVQLQGYPPWQVRLTEIYHMQDNNGVGYQVFLRALHNYAKSQMKLGR